MRKFWVTFKFESLTLMKKKAWIITTVFFLLLALVLSSLPGFLARRAERKAAQRKLEVSQEQPEEEAIGVLWPEPMAAILLQLDGLKDAQVFEEEAALKAAITTGEITKGFVFDDPYRLRILSQDLSVGDLRNTGVEAALRQLHLEAAYEREGIDRKALARAQDLQVEVTPVALGKNAASNFMVALFGMLLVYMMVLIYGQLVAVAVAREKDNRTMELLITTTKPTYLIWGKVLAITAVSSLQVFLLLGTGMLGLLSYQDREMGGLLQTLLQALTPELLGLLMLYTMVGAFMYFFIFASLGALVSKVEDVGAGTAPIQVIFIGSYFLCSTAMQQPEGALMRFLSIFPFSSPMGMYVRASLTTVPTLDLVLSVALLFVTTLLLAHVAVRLYRMGSLLYGKRVGLAKALSMLLSKEH